MKIAPKYRLLTLALAGLFSVFNIGLPIVIATCPMAERGPCDVCADPLPTNGTAISRHMDYSCCATVVAADRNTQEFLQASKFAIEVVLQSLEAGFMTGFIQDPDHKFSHRVPNLSFSPPTRSLPILFSSLLI